ncbi:MAG: hypothetical protein H5U40_14105, partial [Polyangiaceae bacterium]|nr:hypothetical protein [Polyangiaceae bacterium]
MTLPTQPPTPGAGTDLFPRRAFFKDRPEVTTARPALGLTLYLDDPEAWARGHAAALLERVIELVSVQRLQWFTSS